MKLNVGLGSSSAAADSTIIKDAEANYGTDSEIEYIEGGRRKDIGIISAIFLIFNRMIGTGIFATPSTILLLCGSVGLSLFIWVAGTLIAAAGLMVYLEWGSAIPKNGGEKNYLEYYFTRPKFLVTSMYASYVFLLGWAASNSVIFGEYILYAAGTEVTRWNQRLVGLACVTFAFLVHAFLLKWGLRLQNVLGVFKLVVIMIIIVTGWVALSGRLDIEPTHAFTNAFEGTDGTAYGVVTALYNVIWSFIGYSNANYALAEAKNPNKILKVAAPLALVSVAILYMLTNIAYFAVVPRETISGSGRILAASFFSIVFGKRGETALSVFVALSALGNVMSVIFSQGRIVQELGREGLLPCSKIFASNKPLNTPLAGLFEHWVVSVIVMLAPPPGDAYNFILNLISYPLSIVNTFVALALIGIYLRRDNFPDFKPKIKATLPVTIFFLLSSIYLVIAPFVPPSAGQNVYEHLPYYLHCVVAIGIFAAGGLYWLLWSQILPRIGGYTIDRATATEESGWTRQVLIKRYADGSEVPVRF
ncbi:high-affinity methionine permease [Trichomonascus vanleenenianus]|uniref:high-affinity methionine permease n=1 Tax=Trichomonascus vanleenenianus TaxID=2268995 RepID=UPI003ECB72BF